ncbi:MAG TPA: DUF6785 family protein [Planctomycetota bacterium]|nr:DUF6785 family protein [Planctomycetota bacterium]
MPAEGEANQGLAGVAGAMARGATARALIVGSLLCAVIGVSTPYATNVMHASYMDLDFSTPAAIFLFFVLVFFVNGALRAVSERLALTSGELVVVYVMMMIGTVIPTMGLTAYWLSTIAAPFYYAAPENQWSEIILPYIPKWLYPDDPMAIKWLYEGLPRGEVIPWAAWAMPLAHWFFFLMALYGVMICAMVIVRKQWVENERLLYPITQLPMEMVRAESRPGFTNPFIRNPWMWAGFAIPFLLGCYIALSHYDQSFPAVDLLLMRIDLFRRTAVLKLRLSFPMIGFSYLLSTSLALSLWFFSLVTTFERAFLRLVGYEGVEQLDPYSQSGGGPLLTHQSQAALFVLVIVGLWMARHHLKAVFVKAIGRGRDVDDSQEILSYKQAFWGMLAGMGYMAFWLHRTGMSLWVAAALVVVSMATFLGVTRIVAAGGVAETRSPMTASTVLISAFGSDRLGPSNLVPFGMTYIWMGDIRTFVMASAANGLKMVSDMKGRKRTIFWAMILAIVVTIVASVWSTMLVAYDHGGANANDWLWHAGPTLPFHYVTRLIKNPEGPSVNAYLFGGIGASVMAGLMFLNQRLVCWPLHPLGFPIASLWLTDELWFSIFIAWAAKALVLRYGGADLYKRTRLFFLGLILGQYAVSGVWIVIDYFTGKVGNSLFWI